MWVLSNMRKVGFLIIICSIIAPTNSADPCEELQEPIDPCTCAYEQFYGYVLDCSEVESGQQLLDIPGLHTTPGLAFGVIMLMMNPDIIEIPEGAFGEHYATYQYTVSYNPNLTSIHPSFFSPSGAERVYAISVKENALTSFPFDTLKNFRNLYEIDLNGNQIEAIPASAFNNISQSLEFIRLDRNKISFIGHNAFNGLSNLQELWLQDNQLTVLGSESLAFSEEGSDYFLVYLGDNLLWDFEENFINGFPLPLTWPGMSSVDMQRNQIDGLSESTWRPILEASLQASGNNKQPVLPRVNLNDNPLRCNCRMYWLYQMKEAEAIFGGYLDCGDEVGSLWQLEESHFDLC